MKWRSLFAAMLCSVALFSCSDDDEQNGGNENVPQNVLDAFSKKYQGVKDVQWNQVKDFYVARFNSPISRGVGVDYTTSAWFTSDGNCHQSDEDIAFGKLPEIVQTSFNDYLSLFYNGWKVDDCEMVLRSGILIYVIEIEKGNEEREISISEKGDILKDVIDTDGDDYIFPIIISQELMNALHKLYPDNWNQIGILEVEMDDDEVEVDIFDNGRHKELKFDMNYALVSVEYEVTWAEVVDEKILQEELRDKVVDFVGEQGIDITKEGVISEIEVKDEGNKGISFEMEFKLNGKKVEIKVDKKGEISLDD